MTSVAPVVEFRSEQSTIEHNGGTIALDAGDLGVLDFLVNRPYSQQLVRWDKDHEQRWWPVDITACRFVGFQSGHFRVLQVTDSEVSFKKTY